MAGATLTLGCNTFSLNPTAGSGVTVTGPNGSSASKANGNFEVRTSSPTNPSPLVVQSTTTASQALSSHTVTFKTALGTVSVDTTREQNCLKDTGDRITFEGNVAKATVVAGNDASTGNDRIEFRGTLGTPSSTPNSTSQVITGACNDSIIFASSAGNGYQNTNIQAGRGSDSISFTSTTKVGTGVVIDFGAQSGNGDIDVLFGASKTTFQSAGILIKNFDVGYDQVRIGSNNPLKTQAAINGYFGNTNSITLI